MTYAYKDASIWHTEVVTGAESCWMSAQLALDQAGWPHLVCYRYSYPDYVLSYAYSDAVGWNVEPVDSVGAIGSDPSFHLDGDRFPHVSYTDADTGLLRYAYRDTSGWHIEVVDSIGGASLDLDASDYPHLAYGDKYAYRDADGWHIETVTGNPGYARSLVLDTAGNPHIAYGDWPGLKYAYYFESDYALYLPIVIKAD